jgi:hypothetical protein
MWVEPVKMLELILGGHCSDSRTGIVGQLKTRLLDHGVDANARMQTADTHLAHRGIEIKNAEV